MGFYNQNTSTFNVLSNKPGSPHIKITGIEPCAYSTGFFQETTKPGVARALLTIEGYRSTSIGHKPTGGQGQLGLYTGLGSFLTDSNSCSIYNREAFLAVGFPALIGQLRGPGKVQS